MRIKTLAIVLVLSVGCASIQTRAEWAAFAERECARRYASTTLTVPYDPFEASDPQSAEVGPLPLAVEPDPMEQECRAKIVNDLQSERRWTLAWKVPLEIFIFIVSVGAPGAVARNTSR